jgi:hypothetical protein
MKGNFHVRFLGEGAVAMPDSLPDRHKGRLVEHEMKPLVQMLSTAASQVAGEYFQLPVVDADAVYRERA